MEYKASLDSLSKVITAVVIIIFAVIEGLNIKLLIDAPFNLTIVSYLGFILVTLLLPVGCYVFSTQKYLVTGNELIIKRPIEEISIMIDNIEEVRLLDKNDTAGMLRTFGVGGLFGYYGKYFSGTNGTMTLYTTQRKNRILIRKRDGDKIVISPDDVGLLDKLKSELQSRR